MWPFKTEEEKRRERLNREERDRRIESEPSYASLIPSYSSSHYSDSSSSTSCDNSSASDGGSSSCGGGD